MQYSTIQQRIYRGYAIAAKRVGPTYQWFRPVSASDPLGPASSLGTIPASFSTDASFTYTKANKFNSPFWWALVDGRLTQAGDYFTDGGTYTFYIASQPPLLPINVVNTNRVLTFTRPTSADGVGLLPYDGDITDTPILTNWPAAVVQGTRGEKGDTALPGDLKLPWFEIYLPAFPGIQIKAFDVAQDEALQRYKIASTEKTDLGWRLTAGLVQT